MLNISFITANHMTDLADLKMPDLRKEIALKLRALGSLTIQSPKSTLHDRVHGNVIHGTNPGPKQSRRVRTH